MSDDLDYGTPFVGGDEDYDDSPLASDLLEDDFSGTETPTPEPAPEPKAEDPAPEQKTEEPKADEANTEDSKPEPEPEQENEPENEDEPEPEKPKQHMIPKSRLDTETAKRRELEQKLLELEKQLKPADTQIQAPEDMPNTKEIFDLVLDGDVEKAGQMFQQAMMQMAQATANAVKGELTERIDQAPTITQQQMSIQQEAERIAKEYDVFNNQSEAYDTTLETEVVDLRDFYMKKGYQPTDALRLAAETVVKREGITPNSIKQAAPKKPARPTEPNIDQKIKTANSQPPQTAGDRNASEPQMNYDVTKMSDDDLDKLSEDQLARLRGDIL